MQERANVTGQIVRYTLKTRNKTMKSWAQVIGKEIFQWENIQNDTVVFKATKTEDATALVCTAVFKPEHPAQT
jgi:hypothetical protein